MSELDRAVMEGIRPSSFATNPGRVRVKYSVWVKHYPIAPAVLILLLIVATTASFINARILVLAALAAVGLWLHWRRARAHMYYGASNPGVVVSTDPMLIAVFTDLSKGEGAYPAVKIIAQQLPRLDGVCATLHQQVATVAVYKPSDDNVPCWGDFDPRPVQCATDDSAEVKRVAEAIAPEEWAELMHALAYVPTPYKPGLYHLPAHASAAPELAGGEPLLGAIEDIPPVEQKHWYYDGRYNEQLICLAPDAVIVAPVKPPELDYYLRLAQEENWGELSRAKGAKALTFTSVTSWKSENSASWILALRPGEKYISDQAVRLWFTSAAERDDFLKQLTKALGPRFVCREEQYTALKAARAPFAGAVGSGMFFYFLAYVLQGDLTRVAAGGSFFGFMPSALRGVGVLASAIFLIYMVFRMRRPPYVRTLQRGA